MFPTLHLPSNSIYIPDSSILLLLHGEGADGSTTIVDSSTYGLAHAASSVQIDTDAYKFGSSSILFNGSGQSLYYTDNARWNLYGVDWTIEYFMRSTYQTTNVNDDHIFSLYKDANNFFAMHIDPAGEMSMYKTVAGAVVGESTGQAPDPSTWYHRCAMRKGDFIYHFLDGVNVGTMNATWWNSDLTALYIGVHQGGYPTIWGYNGWLDEFRFIKGVAAYPTGGFAPPTAPFPDP